MLSLMLATGLRRGELACLRVGDLNLSQVVAFIEASTSESRRARAGAFGANTTKAITPYLRHPKAPSGPQEPLWRARTGLPLTGNEIYHTIQRRAKQAGLRVHPHQLRHTWASSMLSAGHSEGDVMTLGGWSDRSMLNRYGASAAAERTCSRTAPPSMPWAARCNDAPCSLIEPRTPTPASGPPHEHWRGGRTSPELEALRPSPLGPASAVPRRAASGISRRRRCSASG
jgi:hypothetical protein